MGKGNFSCLLPVSVRAVIGKTNGDISGKCPGGVFAIPNPFSYGACISLWRSIEKKGQKILLALRGLELTDFGSTAQRLFQSSNDATNKSLCNMVYSRNKPIH